MFLPSSLSQVVQRWLLPVFCCGCLCVSGTPCAPPQKLLARCWSPSSPSSPSSARTTSQYCFTCLSFGLWTDCCQQEGCFGCGSKCVDAVFTLCLFIVVGGGGGDDDTRLCWCLPQYLLIIVSVYCDLLWLFEGHEWVNKLKSVSLPGLIVPFENPRPPPKKNPKTLSEWITCGSVFCFCHVILCTVLVLIKSCCDCRYHLQAFRHLYVLAAKPRIIIPHDVDSGKACFVPIQVKFKVSVVCRVVLFTLSSKIPVLKNPCLQKNPWARLRLEQSKGCLHYKNKGNQVKVL